MEPQNQSVNLNPQPMMEPVKKCKHLPIIIILAILTIGGLSFGGYELWQNMQINSNVKTLQEENDAVKQELRELTKLEKEKTENSQNPQKENQQDEINDKNLGEATVSSQDEVRIAILDSGKVCVVDVNNGSVITCAEDVEEEVRSFVACDSSVDILNCAVTTLDDKYYAKFIYNRIDGTFVHGNFVEY